MIRWTPTRKKKMVRMWNLGRLKEVKAALVEYEISTDEFASWLVKYGERK